MLSITTRFLFILFFIFFLSTLGVLDPIDEITRSIRSPKMATADGSDLPFDGATIARLGFDVTDEDTGETGGANECFVGF